MRHVGKYGHIKTKEEGHVLTRIVDAPIPEKKRRGKPGGNYDSYKRDMKSAGYMVDILYRTYWNSESESHSGDPR